MKKDLTPEQTKEKFFSSQQCAWCQSLEQLELDRVNPLEYQTDDIWTWDLYRREKHIKDECQVLCGPCYRRKKSMWKKFRIDNEDWYQRLVSASGNTHFS